MASSEEHFTRYRQEGIRYLRVNIPEVQKIESLDILKDLKLIRQIDLDEIVILQYEATAPDLFPAVRKNFIEMGIVKKHNVSWTGIKNKGTADERYEIMLCFYGASLQIYLDIGKS